MNRLFAISLLITITWMPRPGWASAEPPPYVRKAEAAYKQGDYKNAARFLLAVPGMAQLTPKLTPLDADARARIFFDLGCSYLAAEDSTLADQAFKEAFALNDRLQKGYFESANPGTFWWALLRNQEAARRLKTKPLFAAMRSAAIPGWGQFYRGHKAKGLAFLGAAVATATAAGLYYLGFRKARKDYEKLAPALGNPDDAIPVGAYELVNLYKTVRYANGDGTYYTEWEARHRVAQSNAKHVNMMLGVLSAIWFINITDSAVFGPASMGPMGLTISF